MGHRPLEPLRAEDALWTAMGLSTARRFTPRCRHWEACCAGPRWGPLAAQVAGMGAAAPIRVGPCSGRADHGRVARSANRREIIPRNPRMRGACDELIGIPGGPDRVHNAICGTQ